jgi:RhtB (resistance to homoserine/threonine) family protein
MEYIPLIITVTLINLVGAISPGPDFVMCVRNSLMYSRRTGIFTGIGIGIGLSVHISYCAAGLGLIVSQSVLIFNIVKILGAAYLLYMGFSSFIKAKAGINVENVQQTIDISRFQAIKTGFLCNLLNPKAAVFFLGLFALVIGNNTPTYVVLIVTAIVIFTAIIWFAFVATIFSHQKIKRFFIKYEIWFNWFFGGLLILLGVKIAFSAF